MKFDTRLTELMAVAASVTANCQTCLAFHVEQARAAGADRDELVQAVDIGRRVRSGAAAELNHVIQDLLQDQATASSRPATGCGCAGAVGDGGAR